MTEFSEFKFAALVHFNQNEEYYDIVPLKIQLNALIKISIFYDILMFFAFLYN